MGCKLHFTPQFIPGQIRRLAQIILEAPIQGCLFLFLPLPEGFFSSTEANLRWRHVVDPFMVTPVAIELDELGHGRPPRLLAGKRQQISRTLCLIS